MKHAILLIFCVVGLLPTTAQANDDAKLVSHLKQVYNVWRHSMITKNAANWKKYTSQYRQVNVRNRLFSERRAFPQGVFNTPAAPPNITTLKALRVRVNKNTAKSVYYGKVDFGVGGQPTDNLFLVSYVKERTGWKYDGSDFVNLNHLPKVREAIAKGDLKFVDQNDFKPDGVVPKPPIALTGPAKYIAKVYVFCPKAVLTVRLYLMSEVKGNQPKKVLEYQVENGKQPKANGTMSFVLDRETAKYLSGK